VEGDFSAEAERSETAGPYLVVGRRALARPSEDGAGARRAGGGEAHGGRRGRGVWGSARGRRGRGGRV
jgi:hypothetical protein